MLVCTNYTKEGFVGRFLFGGLLFVNLIENFIDF
jgi:hypothetical protein